MVRATGDWDIGSSRVRIALVPPPNFANFVSPLCQCLSQETLKSIGPFYLVSMPEEVDDPTQVR